MDGDVANCSDNSIGISASAEPVSTAAPSQSGSEGSAERTLTYGEKAVGLTFNPGGDPKVTEIKTAYAKIIDLLDQLRNEAGRGEKGRLLSNAITEAQGAQMWAVKGITWKD